jgi:hypothetical protein
MDLCFDLRARSRDARLKGGVGRGRDVSRGLLPIYLGRKRGKCAQRALSVTGVCKRADLSQR